MMGFIVFIGLWFFIVPVIFILYCFYNTFWGQNNKPRNPDRPVGMGEAFDMYYRGELVPKNNSIDEVLTMYETGQIKRGI